MNPKKALAAHPYFTQSGKDREGDGDQYIANMREGATAGFKYFSFDGSERRISVKGRGAGSFSVSDGERVLAVVPMGGEAELRVDPGVWALYFSYHGSDAADFVAFTIE